MIKRAGCKQDIIITWGKYGLQDGNSPIMEELIFLHDFINLFRIPLIGLVQISARALLVINLIWLSK